METQFTKGEWTINRDYALDKKCNWIRILNKNKNLIAEVKGVHCGIKTHIMYANAKLIAAAPLNFQENVNTVNELKAIIEDIGNTDISLDFIKTWAIYRKEKLEQAIKKATE